MLDHFFPGWFEGCLRHNSQHSCYGNREDPAMAKRPMSSDQTSSFQAATNSVKPWIWSIGLYSGTSPLQLAPAQGIVNPVLSAGDVVDVPARFVADPFMLRVDGIWHMFFEVMNDISGKGEIGMAISRNGFNWEYQEIVLKEPFHLSYPCVFQDNGDFYMVPETLDAGSIRLYRAVSFPDDWVHVKDLVRGKHADPSIFSFAGKWWLFACPAPKTHDVLSLYYANDLDSNWVPHPCNPIVTGNNRIARPGGRVLVHDGQLVRFAQDCYPTYGSRVRAFQITELTPTTYRETEAKETPVLVPGKGGWNVSGMHHVDVHLAENGKWLACVDGLLNVQPE